MISPSMFHQIVLPRLQRLTSKLSVPCILYICGDTSSLLEAMGQTGAEVLSLDHCMNLSESRAIAPKAVLGGNVDPVNSLLMGTKEQVVTDTLNCLCTGGTSRFIFCSPLWAHGWWRRSRLSWPLMFVSQVQQPSLSIL